MTKAESIAEFFRAYGVSQPERASIYVKDLREFTDVQVEAGCQRARSRWQHASLPPIGKLIEACRTIALEDLQHRAKHDRQERRDTRQRPLTPQEHLQLRFEAELFREGLAWDYARGAWVAWQRGMARPEDLAQPAYPTMQGVEKALVAVQRGELVGNPEIRRMRTAKSRRGRGGILELAETALAPSALAAGAEEIARQEQREERARRDQDALAQAAAFD
jgi:hypothetical protein